MNLKRIIREKIEDDFKWIDDTPSSIRGKDLIGYYFTHEEEISSRKFFITKIRPSQRYHMSTDDFGLGFSIEYVWWERGNPPNTHPYKSNMYLDTFILRVHNGEYKLYDQEGNYISPELLIGGNSDEEDLNESEVSWMEDTQPTFLEKLKVITETNPNINVLFNQWRLGLELDDYESRVSITDKRGKTYFTSEEIHWDISKEDFLSKIGDALDGFGRMDYDSIYSGDAKDFKELYGVVDDLIIEGKENELKWLQNTGTLLNLTVDDLENYYGQKFITENHDTHRRDIKPGASIYHLEKFYEEENFEWIKDGTKVRWYDPEEESRDLERVWIIKDYDRYLEDTQLPLHHEDIDDLPINIESEDGYSEAEVFLREVEPIKPIESVVNDRVNVCWKEGSIRVCTEYLKTDVIHYFNNSDWVFLSMLNEANDFDWIENIEPTNIHTRNEKFQSYMDGEFEVTHIINQLTHNMEMFSELGEYLRNVAPDDWDLMGVRMMELGDNLAGNRFLGMAFFTTFLNEDILEKVFGSPINHSEFGEGFETNRDYWFSSYIIEINGHLYHVGYDHRGTAFEPDVTTSYDDVMKDAKSLIDYIFEKI